MTSADAQLFRSGGVMAIRPGIERASALPLRTMMLVIAWLTIAVLATGCATRAQNVFKTVSARPANGSHVAMLVATTRKASSEPGLLYSGDRGTAISLNTVDISLPPDSRRKIGEVQWPARMPPNPEREFAVTGVSRLTSPREAQDWFRQHRTAKRQALIFVHGFNNTYADAVFRFAQIVHDSGTDAVPILFTWPSGGSVLDYLYDKESANYSRRALEDLILQTARSPDVDGVTILAHSMGGWLAAEALRGVAMREKSIPAKVRSVILASPDIDIDVFRRQFVELGPKRPQFVILTSTHDRALEASALLSGGVNRVGGTDFKPYAAEMKQLGVDVIDTSELKTGDPLGHNTFAESPEVVRLLGRRLARQSLEGEKSNVVEDIGVGAATLAGSVATATIAVPVAVVSPEARNLLRRQFLPSPARAQTGEISY